MATVTVESKAPEPPKIVSVTLVLSEREAQRLWSLTGSDFNEDSLQVYRELDKALRGLGREYEPIIRGSLG